MTSAPPNPSSTSSTPKWLPWALLLGLGVLAVVLLLPSAMDGGDTDDVEDSKKKAGFVLSASKERSFAPLDSEIVLFAKMHPVLRSPIMPLLELNREQIWRTMPLDPKVKAFLETSGLDLEKSKSLAIAFRGLNSRSKRPEAVADWHGSFVSEKVRKAFLEATQATVTAVSGTDILAAGNLALRTEQGLTLGQRPFFDDAITTKERFEDIPEVTELLATLDKQGAITAVGRGSVIPNMNLPAVDTEPLKTIRWWAITLETMGPPTLRAAFLSETPDQASDLSAAVESALGLASLALGALSGDMEPVAELINRCEVTEKGRVVTLSVEYPLNLIPALVKGLSGLHR
jgi:hypothetical protein